MAEKEKFDLIEESDRGCVIVGAAILEGYLAEDIEQAFLLNGLSNRYIKSSFDGNGAVGAFSSKVIIARGFGLIDDDVFHDLMVIRKLRNEFAHSPVSASFNDVSVKAKIDSLRFSVSAKESMAGFKRYSVATETVKEGRPLKEWDVNAAGYVKYYKSLFCIIVSRIEIRFLELRYARLSRRIDLAKTSSVSADAIHEPDR
jgi:mannitol operon repressor